MLFATLHMSYGLKDALTAPLALSRALSRLVFVLFIGWEHCQPNVLWRELVEPYFLGLDPAYELKRCSWVEITPIGVCCCPHRLQDLDGFAEGYVCRG